ncbi:LysR family transcriptional regulator [Microbacterium murale]|uniref:LysR family nod box-dependent transcriptional activator n=1 Tax=Microbacterium murale TaxID=1081040 RepID=A0ABU0P766_9MICO|nr:LysR family transcriptional regulator [Microbacterium murale]MDQ0642792.1 LysR family nod box-dependent transcriptional activator [Microbacterium murale]
MPERPPLSRLDLNLLVALDALLTERSVTKAAERLHLSQPALSASLARLRTHFNDPLLARRGNAYELTALAIRLTDHTSTALESARRVFDTHADWTPEHSAREFSIYGSDYAFATIGAAVSALAAERAPGVRFRFMLHSPTVIDELDTRLRSVDGLLIPHGFLTDLPYLDLWRDRWLIVASDTNERAAEGLTMDLMSRSRWVFTYQSRTAFTSASRQLQQLGIEPHIDAVVESFVALPRFIAGTDRLGLIQSGLADAALGSGGITLYEPPFDATPVLNAMWWHPVHDRDPEHTWMRGLFAEAAQGRAMHDPPTSP